jgi:hypothetical protein
MAVAEFIISAIVNLADEFGFDYSKKTLGIIGVGNVVKLPINLASTECPAMCGVARLLLFIRHLALMVNTHRINY